MSSLDLSLASFDQTWTDQTLPNEPRIPTVPLPLTTESPVKIHPALAYGGLRGHDIRQPPRYDASTQWLFDNATSPGVSDITIYIQQIDKFIVVHPTMGPSVSVHDVLIAVCEAAHAAVAAKFNSADHHLLFQHDAFQNGMTAQGHHAGRFSKENLYRLFRGRPMWGGLTESREFWVLHTTE